MKLEGGNLVPLRILLKFNFILVKFCIIGMDENVRMNNAIHFDIRIKG